jgi:hypothetical protein
MSFSFFKKQEKTKTREITKLKTTIAELVVQLEKILKIL